MFLEKEVILLKIFLRLQLIRAHELITINLFKYINLYCKIPGLGSRSAVPSTLSCEQSPRDCYLLAPRNYPYNYMKFVNIT